MGAVNSNDNTLITSLNRKDFNELYDLGTQIGTGAFATVNKCYSKQDSAEFAVKIINKCYLSNKELFGLQNEIKILKQISHKNIVKLIDIFDDGNIVSMVLEICDGKDLFDQIVSSKNQCFSEKKSAEIIYTISNGLQHLHENGVVHRDLKPENILFGIDGTLKITDFGLAHFCQKLCDKSTEENTSNILYTSCGTPHYVAPEILEDKGYDNKCDLWSLGVILYILLVGYQPFNAKSIYDIYKLIINGKYNFNSKRWNNISDDAKDLVTCLLEVNPNKRYTAKDIKFHSWIVNNLLIGSKE